MRIEPVEVEEKIANIPPKPKTKKYCYIVTVQSSYDRPKLTKILWALDDNALINGKSSWSFKIKTSLSPLDMSKVIANCGFLCKYRRTWFW